MGWALRWNVLSEGKWFCSVGGELGASWVGAVEVVVGFVVGEEGSCPVGGATGLFGKRVSAVVAGTGVVGGEVMRERFHGLNVMVERACKRDGVLGNGRTVCWVMVTQKYFE